jgi:hypothetical protein
MDPGDGIYVTRTLPIDGALLSEVLLRLRRDTAGSSIAWSLGDRGAVEIDANVTSQGQTWTTTARILAGLALAPVRVQLVATSDDSVELSLETMQPLGEIWVLRLRELDELAHAALDELAEELLWHAARAGISSTR